MNYEELLESKTYNLTINYKDKQVEVDKVSLQAQIYRRLRRLDNHKINVYISPSNKTESVYGMITFKNKNGVFLFSIKNHFSRCDSVTVKYFYKDFSNLNELLMKVVEDIKSASATGKYCISAKLSLIQYEALNLLKDCMVSVETDRKGRIMNVSLTDLNGNTISKPRYFGTALVQELYDRKMLIDIRNRYRIQELVLSKLGYLAITRNRHLYDWKKSLVTV